MLLPNEKLQLAIKLDDGKEIQLTTTIKTANNSVSLQNESRFFFLTIRFFGEVTIQFL